MRQLAVLASRLDSLAAQHRKTPIHVERIEAILAMVMTNAGLLG